LLIAATAYADYQEGYDAWLAGDYATAMAEWKAVADAAPDRAMLAEYREALYGIGMLYWQGHGVDQDYSVATVWLKQAADINHPGAATKLGYLYSMGLGVPQNLDEAVKWFRMAAAQGDPDAQHNLAALAQQGLIGDVQALEPVEADSRIAQSSRETAVTVAPGRDAGEDWIARQNPEHYTIQIIALSAPEKLHAFIAEHPDWSPFAIYRQFRYEQPLWVMVQGDYPDVEAARSARDAFPEGIQNRGKLWIRKFGMVQRLLE
jgi:tetratricopeptide (TPR) repeat protein